MSDTPETILPSASEKLSYKFILDAIKERQLAAEPETAPDTQPAQAPLEKKYFRIGEVAELLDVEPYVLRYWESEFKLIRPQKSGSGHRVYARKDVESLRRIKYLLHVEKFSIKGAKQKMKEEKKVAPPVVQKEQTACLKELAAGLKDLLHTARDLNPGLG